MMVQAAAGLGHAPVSYGHKERETRRKIAEVMFAFMSSELYFAQLYWGIISNCSHPTWKAKCFELKVQTKLYPAHDQTIKIQDDVTSGQVTQFPQKYPAADHFPAFCSKNQQLSRTRWGRSTGRSPLELSSVVTFSQKRHTVQCINCTSCFCDEVTNIFSPTSIPIFVFAILQFSQFTLPLGS